jgi:hypothetical protein
METGPQAQKLIAQGIYFLHFLFLHEYFFEFSIVAEGLQQNVKQHTIMEQVVWHKQSSGKSSQHCGFLFKERLN